MEDCTGWCPVYDYVLIIFTMFILICPQNRSGVNWLKLHSKCFYLKDMAKGRSKKLFRPHIPSTHSFLFPALTFQGSLWMVRRRGKKSTLCLCSSQSLLRLGRKVAYYSLIFRLIIWRKISTRFLQDKPLGATLGTYDVRCISCSYAFCKGRINCNSPGSLQMTISQLLLI